MYLLAKFRLHIPIPAGEVTALQSSNNKTICTGEINYWLLQNPLELANRLKYGAAIFVIVLTMSRGIDYWLRFSLTRPSLLHLKAKFMKKNQWRTIVSM